MKRSRAPSQLAANKAPKATPKTASKKRTINKQKTFVPLGLGFPRRVTTTHKYVTQNLITSTTSAMATYRFAANGLYDPDITNAGHQPMYFDEYAAIYDHYCVLGSKLTLQFCAADTPGGEALVAVIVNDDTSIAPGSVQVALENSDSSGLLVSMNNDKVYTLTRTWSAKKVFGGSNLNNPNMIGTNAGNPVELSFYDIHVQACKAATTTSVRFLATLEYFVEWSEQKDNAGS